MCSYWRISKTFLPAPNILRRTDVRLQPNVMLCYLIRFVPKAFRCRALNTTYCVACGFRVDSRDKKLDAHPSEPSQASQRSTAPTVSHSLRVRNWERFLVPHQTGLVECYFACIEQGRSRSIMPYLSLLRFAARLQLMSQNAKRAVLCLMGTCSSTDNRGTLVMQLVSILRTSQGVRATGKKILSFIEPRAPCCARIRTVQLMFHPTLHFCSVSNGIVGKGHSTMCRCLPFVYKAEKECVCFGVWQPNALSLYNDDYCYILRAFKFGSVHASPPSA